MSAILPVNAESSTVSAAQQRKKPNASSVWKCSRCNKHFCNKFVLERHISKCNMSLSLQFDIVRSNAERIVCLLCQKTFSHKCNLVYHVKRCHSSVDVNTICPTRHKRVSCPGELNFSICRYSNFEYLDFSFSILLLKKLKSTTINKLKSFFSTALQSSHYLNACLHFIFFSLPKLSR